MSADAPFYLISPSNSDNSIQDLPFSFIKQYQNEKAQINQWIALKNDTKIYSALYSTSEDEFAFIHYVYVGFHWNAEPKSILKNASFDFNKRNFKDYTIYENSDTSIRFSMLYANGFIVMSSNSFLLDNYIIKKEKNEVLSHQNNFSKIEKRWNENKQTSILIQSSKLKSLSTNLAKENGQKLLQFISENNSWYYLQITDIKANGSIQLNGIVLSENSLLASINETATPNLFSIIPENLSYYNYYNVKDASSKTDLFKSIASNEILFFNLENRAADYHAFDGLIVKSKDINQSMATLKQYQMNIFKDSIYFGNTKKELNRLNFASQIADAFAHNFYKIQSPYYFYINDYIVFLNSKEASELFIEKYLAKNTIKNIPNTPAQFLCNVPSSKHIINDLSKNESIANSILQFNQIKISYKKTADNTEVELLFSKDKEAKKSSTLYSIWKNELSTSSNIIYLSSTEKHDKTGFFVFAQDANQQLFCINDAGEKLWEKELDSKVLSQLYAIDYYKNGSEQYVFNTENKIYIIDKQGNFIEGFPLNLGGKANCALTCFYKGNDLHQAYYYVPCNNGNIYGYEINGLPLAGWNPKKAGQVKSPIQIAYQNNKEYLFYYSDKSALEFFDYKGVSRMNRLNDEASQYQFSIISADSSSYLFNAYKNVLKYNLSNNTVEAKTFGPGEGVYAYIAYLPAGSKVPNHAYIKENKLVVLNSKGEKQFVYPFKEEMQLALKYQLINKKDYLLCANKSQDKFYLIDSKGNLTESNTINTTLNPLIINNANKTYMISIDNHNIICSTF